MKRSLFLIFILFSITKTQAKEVVSGYYINLTNDTIKCNFELPGRDLMDGIMFYILLQKKIQIINSEGKVVKYKPKQLKGFTLFYPNDTLRFITVSFPEEIPDGVIYSPLFLKLEKDGFAKLFKYYYGSHSSGFAFTFYFKKGDLPIANLWGTGSKKNFDSYFSDYPELQQKITKKEYNDKDVLKIITEYNTWHSQIK